MAIYNARIDCWYCYTGLDYDYIFDADGETIFMHEYTLYRLGNGCVDDDGTVEGALYTAVMRAGSSISAMYTGTRPCTASALSLAVPARTPSRMR